MYELIARVAAVAPQRPATLTHDRVVTYGELAVRARSLAAHLRVQRIDRLALARVEADEVLVAWAAGSLAGTQLCLYPPDGPEEWAALAARFDHDVVWADGPCPLDERAPADPGEPERATERPLLVLTTGTTGAPRGVRHDWNRLLRSVERIEPTPASADERWLLAYGLHQFAGLQVLLHVMAAGATLVAPAPRRPVAGLRALRELGVTHASATPTYWRFLLAELRSSGHPAPTLRQITLGGEAVPDGVLADLHATFPDARISHVYAASEFGSSGSVRDARAGLPVTVLQRGDDAAIAMRIVDDELWVRSRTGMLGYYGEPDIDADGWRPTGDLVRVEGERIVFTGRTSEVINVGGVKVHPLPIEARVLAVPGVRIARVHGRPNPVTGSVVAVEFVADTDPAADVDLDPAALKAAIRAATADLPAAARPRSIRQVDAVRTRGDKVVRSTA